MFMLDNLFISLPTTTTNRNGFERFLRDALRKIPHLNPLPLPKGEANRPLQCRANLQRDKLRAFRLSPFAGGEE
jgi:hypothetical protein